MGEDRAQKPGFEPGDVVQSVDGTLLGVVVSVIDSSEEQIGLWDLHVDCARNGEPDGVSVWSPESARRTEDPAALAEARRLRLGM